MNRYYTQKVVSELDRRGLDAILIAPSLELRLLTGFSPMLCARFQGMFLTKEGTCFYVCNVLTGDEAKKHLDGCSVYTWHDNDGFEETVMQALKDHDLIGKKIGVNNAVRAFNILRISAYADVTFVNAEDLLAETRIYKTDEELTALQEAADIAAKALNRTLSQVHAGMLEKEVKEILEKNLTALGADYGSAMVASGPNSGFPHYNSSGRVIQTGDALLIDFACIHKGMISDVTRTYFVGKPNDQQEYIYKLVYDANKAAEAALNRGERWIPSVERAARSVIDGAGYGEYFTTRLGHGLGCMPHEAPDIKTSNRRYLEPRMVFTIEPGIYLPDFGVRIEDFMAIAPDGQLVIFSKDIPKAYTILE